MEYPVILKSKSMEIRLEQHDLPEPPLSYTSTTILKKNHYPGNPDPTVQVLGTKHQEIEIQGVFKDKFKRTDGYAQDMIAKLQEMRSLGEETTFQYASQIFIGMLEEVTPSIYNIHEINYKIKFNIFRLAHEKVQLKVLPSLNIDGEKMEEQSTEIEQTINEIKNIPNSLKGQAKELTENIKGIVNQVSNGSLGSIQTSATSALQNIKSMIAGVNGLSIDSFADKIGINQVWHDLVGLRQQIIPIMESMSTSYQFGHIVALGDNLMDLAQKYLGNKNRWTEIAELNNLSNLVLTMGQKLVIPK